MNVLRSVRKYPDLIYDVGMHNGEDTGFYLSKGFRVIAFEADPKLIEYTKNRFSEAIENQTLVVVEGAIVNKPVSERVTFYKSSNSVWGTVDSIWAERNEARGAINTRIEVDAIDFSECIEKYGIPYYMKIDVEGADTYCLGSLMEWEEKPDYVSFEIEILPEGTYQRLEECISLLAQFGYDAFEIVSQTSVPFQQVPNVPKEGIYVWHMFPRESSGLFGKELPGKWLTKEEVLKECKAITKIYNWFGPFTFWQRTRKKGIGTLFEILDRVTSDGEISLLNDWHDIHARHSSAAI